MMISIKTLAISILAVVIIALAVWAGFRYWKYEQQDPLRSGVSALKSGDYQAAMNYIRPFAEAGDSHAQELLGSIYAFGLGVHKDTLRARIWFRRAEGSSSKTGVSEYYVALDYLDKGHLASIDTAQALEWLQYAAEAGNTDAQLLLSDPAKLADKGLDVQPDVINHWRRFVESK